MSEKQKEKFLKVEVTAKEGLKIFTQNLQSYKISYYTIDLEMVFSNEPFIQNHDLDFSFIVPNKIEKKVIPAEIYKANTLLTNLETIPDEFKNKN